MSAQRGLSSAEAESLLGQFGSNEIKIDRRNAALKLLLSQFTDPIMLLLGTHDCHEACSKVKACLKHRSARGFPAQMLTLWENPPQDVTYVGLSFN